MNELAAAAAEGTGPMNWLIGAATVVVAAVGLWLAHSYRRQMVLRLSQTRLEAYSRLWEITGVAAPTRLDGWGEDGYLRIDERRELWEAMTDWYYGDGGGMLLTAITKDVYLNVKRNLICEPPKLRPRGLAKKIEKELPEGRKLDDKVLGILAIRLVSLLRTQLKSDLTIYGATYSGKLAEYERFFLEESGVNLYSKAWATAAGRDTWWWRPLRPLAFAARALKRKRQDSSEPGESPSPLWGIRVVLRPGKTARTPLSSRIAVKNALGGRFRWSPKWRRQRQPIPAMDTEPATLGPDHSDEQATTPESE